MMLECPPGGLPQGPDLSPEETTFRWLGRPYAFLDDCAAQYGDSFTLHFKRFGTHVVVSHPEDVFAVFSGDRNVLHAGRGNALLEPVLGAGSVLLADGDEHLAQRVLLQPAFRSDSLPAYARAVVEATRRWTATWEDGEQVSIQNTALEISKEVILRIVFGLSGSSLTEMSKLVHELMMLVATNATFDEQSTEARLLQRFRSAKAALDEHLQDLIERRRRETTIVGNDVLSTLVAARTTGGGELSDAAIRDQLVTMILAGHETTASSITWALVCLHNETPVLQRLTAEIDAGKHLPDAHLGELPYLQAVALETLRLRPVIPVVSRQVQAPFRLRDRTLEPGVYVTPCAYLAHRRADSFADPQVFRPERFLDRRYAPYVYFPFGGGVRRCMGMSFALLEMQIVVGILLRTFRFAPLIGASVRPVRRAVTIVASGGGKMKIATRAAA